MTIAKRAAALLFGLWAMAAPVQAEQYRLGLITPPPHEWTQTATRIADRLRDQSGGRIDILIFPAGQMGSEAQMLQQLQTGALDFGFLTLGEFTNRDESYGALLAPYLVRDAGAAADLLQGRVAGRLLEGTARFGLQGLAWGMAGMRQVVMKGDVAGAEDLRGKKIRTVPLAQELDFWTRVGATPTPMPLPALYDAFANGQVDGMQIDFEGTWNSKYYEQAGTIIASDHMMFPMLAVASGRKWRAMAEDDRALIAAVLREDLAAMARRYADIDAEYLERLRTTPVPVIRADRAFFGAAVEGWYQEWRKRTPILTELEAEAAAR